MRKRSRAREYALQLLYQVDIRHGDYRQIVQEFWEEHHVPHEVQLFANQLIEGTMSHLDEIDALIVAHADNWALKRMATVDRNILRLGVFELRYLSDVPPKVSINEALEVAKRYGDTDSSKFINGVLDAVHKQHPRSPSSETPAPSSSTPIAPPVA